MLLPFHIVLLILVFKLLFKDSSSSPLPERQSSFARLPVRLLVSTFTIVIIFIGLSLHSLVA
jgi:hypothetical protein